ncbi:Na(+)/H(+) antiporter 2 [Magnaporthiopsis poae ATCC 64411]|uniref:Na(+)/H(+) antiporter 2 n=1 Tax=Magnaporthiopsis poae (strain ATCC 64411 / 73-15) TaxID=644358 RepID=A0A0C4EG65_MAGP6|nr:Na(+)/H(+) antiporter 2 [Magnaporthiopsis poae ATCC 64411]
MGWEHLSITKPHLVYIILGGFTSLFMLCSSVIKERMYIGEATVATLCGLIFGPHAANLINPQSWGNVDIVTIEFSRIVLVVQCFAIGVELPKFYMERHWRSVVFLLLPVMTFGWLITSVIVWWLIEPLSWLESLVVAACVTATDPVLASSVVGKGKFAKRVPKHLRDLLSAESGCNDGMAFPFTYLSLYLIQDQLDAREVTFHWFVYTILYECVFGAIYGFLIGYFARHGIKYAEKRDLIDRESFLVFYFVLALFCAGSGSILGVDDLLVGFSAGVGFSNDGWFGQKTEESHVSNVIDLLLNLTYFVYLGTIIPWEMFNNAELGLSAWRLTVMAILVILFRRIPIMMALKPLIPDIKTWREALFAGHFGPIGVGAIFIAILARAELESEKPVPLAELPPSGSPHYTLIILVWPVVTFIVVASILVHGSSIAVFTLGKHINTLTLTMSYTAAPEDGPSWMNRLPRITSQSRSQARTMSDTEVDDAKLPDLPPGTLPPIGYPGHFLRRVRDEDRDGPVKHGSRASSAATRRRRKMWDDGLGPGGPISQSAIFPQRRVPEDADTGTGVHESPVQSPVGFSLEPQSRRMSEPDSEGPARSPGALERQSQADSGEHPDTLQQTDLQVYVEGDHVLVENRDGEIIAVSEENKLGASPDEIKSKVQSSVWSYDYVKKKLGDWRAEEMQKRSREKEKSQRKHEPARAYQFGNTIIVEDEDGEVVKKYELPSHKVDKEGGDLIAQGLKYMGIGSLVKGSSGKTAETGPSGSSSAAVNSAAKASGMPQRSKKSEAAEGDVEDDKHIRFKIGGVGQRMTEDDFIREMQKLDKSTRREVVDQSSASGPVKALAKQDTRPADQPEPAIPREADREEERGRSRASSTPPKRQPETDLGIPRADRSDEEETTAERRRRMAVLESVHRDDDGEEAGETPAERRRREAALGIRAQAETAESESDDDDTPRVPPGRRGIRFADAVGRQSG